VRVRSRLLGAIALLVLPAALVFGGLQVLRWHAMGEPQRAALALLQVEPPGRDGTNAYPWLAAMDHDVPIDQVEEAMAADVLRFEAWSEKRYLQATSGGEPRTDHYAPFHDSGFAPRDRVLRSRDICTGQANRPCLAHVRARLEDHKSVVLSESARLAMLDRVLASSHVSSPYPPGFRTPYLRLDAMYLEMTAAAVDAAEGRTTDALARACRLLAWSRRATGSSDNWLDRSTLRALWESASGFLLELRREFPSTDLPPPCDRALAPLRAEELVGCAPEGRTLAASLRDSGPARASLLHEWNPLVRVTWHLIDYPRLGAAWMAQELAQGCGESARQALANGAPLPPFEPVTEGLGLSCYAAMHTCGFRRRWAHDRTPPSYRTWPNTTRQWARLKLLEAGHALADATLAGGRAIPLPLIPGFPIEHDASGKVLVIRLSEDQEPTEYVVDIAGFTAPVPLTAK